MNFFASRYAITSLKRRWKKNVAGILAIALGVTLYVGVSAGSNGLAKGLASNWWSYVGDTDIEIVDDTNTYFPITHSEYLESAKNLHSALGNLIVASPVIKYFDQPMYIDGQFEKGVQVTGIVPNEVGYRDFITIEGKSIDIESLLTVNSDLTQPQPVIVSKELAKVMDLETGSIITSAVTNGNGSFVQVEYNVKAIYDDATGRGRAGMFRIQPALYTNIGVLQSVLIPELQDHITRISMVFAGVDKNLENLDIEGKWFDGKHELEEALELVRNLFVSRLPQASIWSERLNVANEVYNEVQGIKGVLNIFVFLLNATALLLVINVQSMSFEDRRNQTAILRSMGSTKSTIVKVFLTESTIVGLIGSIVGLGLGILYGNYINSSLATIFEGQLSGAKAEYSVGTVIGAISLGILLSVATAVIPAYRSAGKPIASELRGLDVPKTKKETKRIAILGFGLFVLGLSLARNVGEFWKKEAWSTFENQVTFLLAFGVTLFGLGLLLSLVTTKKKSLNFAGFSIWFLAFFSMFKTINWVENGDADNWFTVILVYLTLGSSLLAVNNFEQIMLTINRIMFQVPKMRSVSQVTSKQLIGKKTRATLVFTIFTIILILSVFLSTAANTMRNNYTDQYNWRSYGIDVVVNTESVNPALADISAEISSLSEVEHVYAFKSARMPVYYYDEYSGNFATEVRRVVVIPKEVLNPDNNWKSENAFPISFDSASGDDGYDYDSSAPFEEQRDFSIRLLEDFYSGKTRTIGGETQTMAIGGFFYGYGASTYLPSDSPQGILNPVFLAGTSVSFMGDWNAFGGTVLITPEMALNIPEFDTVAGPNLFLVRSSNEYHDGQANLNLAQDIEQRINDLGDPTSLSSQFGTLIGATTRIVQEVMGDFWETEAQVWDFLATFSFMGLIIGGAGLAVIAVRSVSERTREIGMMRAIGFTRRSVVSSILMEMLVLALLGLISGILNGVLITEMFTGEVMGVTSNYPMQTLATFSGAIVGLSLIAAIIPGMRAARVAPSQALRYTG
ncbi:MAG: FtsX-like permease family protein [Candidatus Heimdallarchaeota archaeon]|nr:FtsX-like permease family protein [Candidatus Heimdallarchaeota archaeon]